MIEKSLIPRVNNFDLIRLVAALQVVFMHSFFHLKINNELLKNFFEKFIQYFPGVPIFFTVSGFLIFWAFDRNPNLNKYITNRILRLYPALYICLSITIILLFLFSTKSLINQTSFYIWLAAQMSFFQFYTPEILRFWGVGTPNGSLWTIAVEVQFYILVPIIYFLIKRIKGSYVLFFFFLTSVCLNIYFSNINISTLSKLSGVSILPYLFNFLVGSFFYFYWNKLKKIIENKFLVWICAYIIYFNIFGNFLSYQINSYHIVNIFNFISVIFLSITTLSFAFSFNSLSERLLKRQDISYGIYIYHMLVVNTFLTLGFQGSLFSFISVFIVTILLSLLSWNFIEKKALSLKSKN